MICTGLHYPFLSIRVSASQYILTPGCVISATSVGSLEVDYYQVDIPPGIYYYVSQGSSLLDPDGMADRTSDSSSISISRGNFRERVAARDTNCVMLGPTYAEACHIIPHAKGHQYMINLANHRHEAFDPPLNDINDTRNGILLALQLHRSFGASEVAFLQTPNFAMTVNDVYLVMQPTAPAVGFAIQPSAADSRLTFQHFNNHDVAVALLAPHNSDARQSDSNEWPPPLIFDVAYGCAALKTWGVPGFINLARQRTKDIYYDYDDNGDDENGDGGGGGGGDRGGSDKNGSHGDGGDGEPDDDVSVAVGQSEKHRQQARAARREKDRFTAQNVGRLANNTEDCQAGDIADVVMALWVRNARKYQRQAHAMKVDSTREKVRTWLESAE